jgi:hypothetical protein
MVGAGGKRSAGGKQDKRCRVKAVRLGESKAKSHLDDVALRIVEEALNNNLRLSRIVCV